MADLKSAKGVVWILGLFLLWFYYKVKQYRRLQQFRGPWSTGFSNILHTKAIITNNIHTWYAETNEKFGPVARIGPNDLITSSPELIFHMNAIRSEYTKSQWYYSGLQFEPGRDNIISLIHEKGHEKQRRRLAPAFFTRNLSTLEPIIDKHIMELIHLIRDNYLSTDTETKQMDLARKIQFLGLDLITDIGFGRPFGDLINDADINKYIEHAEKSLRIWSAGLGFGITKLIQHPIMAKLLGPGESKTGAAGFDKMASTAEALVSSRFQNGVAKSHDLESYHLIDSFIASGLTQQECVTEAVLQVFAGSDTTATSIRTTLLWLFSSPQAYRRIQAEIDDAIQTGKASSPIKNIEARDLPYLQAVLKEGMRIHPPVAETLSKTVPKAGDTIQVDGKDIFLPGGVHVGYDAWALHRSKDVFGEDANVYRPERWIHGSPSDLTRMHKVWSLIFGYGKYRCLGMELALIEIRKSIFELLRVYDFAIINPESPWENVSNMGIFTQSNFWVRVSSRVS